MSEVDGPRPNGPTQDEPIQDGATEATRDDKLAGLVEQVRADAHDLPREEVRSNLLQRLGDAQITVSDDELDGLLERIVGQA
ncbi:hypothetical protein [Glaciibacter flavus]|uniref:hypothetical protein n=1 Tax=Orlajensenia flava TaxID=2565934 RepID=UPI003B006479